MSANHPEVEGAIDVDPAQLLAGLSAAAIADACVAGGIPLRLPPPSIRPLITPVKIAGRARPVIHYGSVDVFFEAIAAANPGDVLVIDNEGRTDEGCIGDLTIAEASAYSLAGAVVWGAHRDTADLRAIGLPVFSTGSCPAGPRGVRERVVASRDVARIGDVEVTSSDIVVGDDDGLLFIEAGVVPAIAKVARRIAALEETQRRVLESGTTLHQQLEWDQYTWIRSNDPTYTFRRHLQKLKKAIET